ncbi:unnamed protein product, partial [Pocillopora meandrina]
MKLKIDGRPASVYCHMGNFGCGDGGWTTVMKIDGDKINQQTQFIVLNQQADSLYSLIADGQHRTTTLGRNTWASLI